MPYVETDPVKDFPEPKKDRQADSEHATGYARDVTWQRETTYQSFQPVCNLGKCEENNWIGDRQLHESEAWGALIGHLRHEHYELVRLTKVRRTSTYEVIKE